MKTITEQQVIEKLKEVKDPELGVDVWTLGLIYKIVITDDATEVLMTLTSPFCPFANDLIADVEKKVGALDHGDTLVDITFDPPWEPTEELRASLGL